MLLLLLCFIYYFYFQEPPEEQKFLVLSLETMSRGCEMIIWFCSFLIYAASLPHICIKSARKHPPPAFSFPALQIQVEIMPLIFTIFIPPASQQYYSTAKMESLSFCETRGISSMWNTSFYAFNFCLAMPIWKAHIKSLMEEIAWHFKMLPVIWEKLQ